MNESFAKTLTKNDTGETGSHQGGILIPKENKELLKFFPKLDAELFNPDEWIQCIDSNGETWKMRYVHYNGKTFEPKRSTRNEYRITYMTKFFKQWSAKSDDSVVFTSTDKPNTFQIKINSTDKDTELDVRKLGKVILRGWNRVC